MNAIASFLTIMSAPFFGIFFISLGQVSGFSVSVNSISVFLLCIVTIIHIFKILNNKFVFWGIIVPWVGMVLLCFISSVLFGARESLSSFLAQSVFLFASLGLAFQLHEWARIDSGSRFIVQFCALACFSFLGSLLIYSPTPAILAMLEEAASFDPISTVYYARRVFASDQFFGNQALTDLASYQNRIAQHMFSFGFILLALLFIFKSNSATQKALKWIVIFNALVFMSFGILLLSGQTLAQSFLTLAFIAILMFIFRFSGGLFFKSCALILPSFVGLFFFNSNPLFDNWLARFTGGNFDTGRFDRWSYYFSDRASDLTFLGLTRSDTLDPHNLYISTLFEFGPVGLLFALVFAIAIITRTAFGLRFSTRVFGVGYLILVVTGLQTIFLTAVTGGWGLPGWAGWSKFTLFVFAIMLSPVRYKQPQTR